MSVMDAGTGEGVRVLDRNVNPRKYAAQVDWSPDSRRLLYHYEDGRGAIRVVRADGKGQPRPLIPARKGLTRQFSAAWSPNGKRIAFIRSRMPDEFVHLSIWTATAHGTRLRRIRSSGPQYYELTGAPTLSWGPLP